MPNKLNLRSRVLLILALTPSLRYRMVEGTNTEVAARSVGESDTYSLRPLHLVLPYLRDLARA